MAKLIPFLGSHKRFPLFILFLLAAGGYLIPATGQDKVVLRGKVVDKRSNETVVGASVLLKDDKAYSGSVTDIDGLFSLNVPSLPTTIVVSYIGYRSQEIDIYEATAETLVVALVEDLNLLNEVVVIGYGTQRRSDISGLVASVPKVNLEQPQTSFDNLLSGAVAGVQVTQSSGQPGASSSIRIRGGNSITGGNEPLYVIDGQIMYNSNAATSAGTGYAGAGLNGLATINPADIASIEVLKDASATAIYGSRGANGVILVTTKKGEGKDRIQYTGSVGQSVIGKKLDLLNGREWALLRNDIITSDAALAISNTPFTQAEIDAIGEGYDWQEAALRTAWTQNHQLSLSGGDEKTKYLVSGSYYNQEGVIVNSGFERYALRANLQRQLSECLKTGLNLSVSASKQSGVPDISGGYSGTNAFVSVLGAPPVAPIYEADGSYHFDQVYNLNQNTIADLKETTNETNVNRTFGNFFAEYKLLPELTAKINAGADLIHAKQNFYAPSYTSGGLNTRGLGSVGNNVTRSWQTELTLTCDRTFNDHHLTALGGYTTENIHTESALAGATNFLNDITGYNDLGSGSPSQPSSDAVTSTLVSWLGRVNYSYRNRYNATVSFRADGSSRFATGNKWAYFPSLGLSWNLHEENFLQDIQAVSNLKLRLSAGSIGNQEIGDFQYLSRYSPVLYSLGRQIVSGYAPENIANLDLRWETTTQYNLGFDLGLLNDRINLILDAYYKLTSDLLVEVPVPTSSGYSQGLKNVGSVSNKGIELTVNAEVISGRKAKSFNWHTALTFARNQNRVESLGDDVDSYTPRVPNGNIGRFNPLIVKEGYALGTFWGYETDGIVQAGDDLSAIPTPSWTTGVKPGDHKYVNHGGEAEVINDADRIILGSAQPKFTFGFTNTFSWKDFDLSVLVQGSYGNKLYNALRSQLEITTTNYNVLGGFRDRWTDSNPSTDYPRATNVPNAVVSDRLIEDASYARLKSATLGYTLPGFRNTVGIERIRLFATGQNLFTLTGYSGFDPEANSYEQNSLYQGIDFGVYPSSRSWLAGIEITF
ncbi:MAG: TonB-dependent receptor [Tannerella sp.]|nr:TonB-dependent receptor [Tannerella sp.]